MKRFRALAAVWILFGSLVVAAADSTLEGARILATKGRVELLRSGARIWDPAQTNLVLYLGDQLRTGEGSRATLLLRDSTILNAAELTTIQVQSESSRSVVELLRGVLSFFHRDKPGDTEVKGGSVSAIIRGTEFVVSLSPAGVFELVLIDGEVEVANPQGRVTAHSGETVITERQQAPRRAPTLGGENKRAMQWIIYYPAILDPADLRLDAAAEQRWSTVLESYLRGDLWKARDRALEIGRVESASEQILLAALDLSVGNVSAANQKLDGVTGASSRKLADALQHLIAAIQLSPCDRDHGATNLLTTELLASSYCLQARGQLESALADATQAADQNPSLGFAQARKAELLFAFGRVAEAQAALESALHLSPVHAAAWSLQGFLSAAKGSLAEAEVSFSHAVSLEPALGDAWLGRGLVRFRVGQRTAGRIDMETAAAVEPHRSVLRSYLGKAFDEEGDSARAFSELGLAQTLDTHDPTPFLYSALLRYRQYQLAGAIEDLNRSAALNNNRAIYRSSHLLDQDAAVRSANLAQIYELADMSDVARRESARAVMFDYANYSAHLNLASSYDALRDPTRFDLRYETVWFNEHLLATLLAPTDAVPLSQHLSQNEYSRLFARNRVGFGSTLEYFSNKDYRQVASYFGNYDRFSFALDFENFHQEGERVNNDVERTEAAGRFKFSLSPQDSILLYLALQDYESGDNFQHVTPSQARPSFRFDERQAPVAFGGYHHEWRPGSHTLFLAGRLQAEQRFSDLDAGQLVAFSFPPGDPLNAPFNLLYRNEFITYSAEAAHILQTERHSTLFGGRFQSGEFEATADLDATPLGADADLFGRTVRTTTDAEFQRGSLYVFHTWEMIENLRLTGGLAFDDLITPANYRRPPLSDEENHRQYWSPKAALIYTPNSIFTARAMYAQSVSGVSYDQSVTLEPTQLAGFPQAFRTIISESLVGSVETPSFDLAGAGFDFQFPTRTWLSIEALNLESAVDRDIGIYDFDAARPMPVARPGNTREHLDYNERSARMILNQIIAEAFFFQAGYQFIRSELQRELPELPAPASFNRSEYERSDLHRISASLLYQRPDGWFARPALTLLHQDNRGAPAPLSEDHARLDFYIGYRFPKLAGDITLGILNITDSDYRLYSLTPHENFVRERTFYTRLRLRF